MSGIETRDLETDALVDSLDGLAPRAVAFDSRGELLALADDFGVELRGG